MAGMAPPNPMQQEARSLVEDSDEPNVSPEEQQAYDAFVMAGYDLIYEGASEEARVAPKVLALLDSDPSDLIKIIGQDNEALQEFSPLVAVAATAAVVVLELVRRGEKPEDDIIFQGGRALYEDLIEIAEKVGKTDFSQDDVNRGFAMAADLYREMAAQEGLVNEDELKAAFDEVVTADKEGRLGDVSPQLAALNDLAAADAAGAEGADGNA